MKFLIDMNLSPMWKSVFENAGHEAEHWINLGNPRASDRELLGWARHHGATVFTNDLDFSAILAATNARAPSVLQVRTEDVMPDAISNMVMSAIAQFAVELQDGAIVVLEPWRQRCRVLPLIKGEKD